MKFMSWRVGGVEMGGGGMGIRLSGVLRGEVRGAFPTLIYVNGLCPFSRLHFHVHFNSRHANGGTQKFCAAEFSHQLSLLLKKIGSLEVF